MQHPERVGRLHAPGHVQGDVDRPHDRHWPAQKHPREGTRGPSPRPRHVFEHEVGPDPGGHEVDQAHQIRMPQLVQGVGLDDQPLSEFFVVGELGGDHLDGDPLAPARVAGIAQPDVFGQIHDTHAAASEYSEQLIALVENLADVTVPGEAAGHAGGHSGSRLELPFAAGHARFVGVRHRTHRKPMSGPVYPE